jgi:fimbrial isopeptide formation D2 family protein/LPXTG-motif cell wall-anchored protein
VKRIKSFLTIIMATIFALSLVPAGAFAADGRITDANAGKITLTNAEDGETYSIYRIFTLLSFDDSDPTAGNSDHHTTDKYSYGLLSTSTWATFFKASAKPSSPGVVWGSDYFDIDENHPITVTGNNAGTYYPVSIKDGGPFDSDNVANQVTPVADETTRIASVADAAVVQPFAKAALKYATDYTVSNNGSKEANNSNGATTGADDNKVKVEFDQLPLGYYLVGSTLGTFVALDTTNKEVTVLDKNEVPTIEKKVKTRANDATNRDGTTGKYTNESTVWGENTDYDIGDTVTFKTRITVPKGAKAYKLHDVMEAGLTLVPGTDNVNFKVYATITSGSDYLTEVTAATGTYVVTTSGLTDGCDFEIELKDAWLDGLAYDATSNQATVEVEYKAMLNKDAVVKGDDETNVTLFPRGDNTVIVTNDLGPADPLVPQITRDHVVTTEGSTSTADGKNTNSAILTFGAKSSTVWDNATVECFDFDLVKTGEATTTGGNDFNLLDAAKFELYRSNSGGTGREGNALVMAPTTISGVTDALVYAVPDSTQTTGNASVFNTSMTQRISFRGLEAGTYWLHETEAPKGYNALSGDIKVVVGTDGNIKYTMPSAGNPAESENSVPANATITYNATQSTYTDNAQGQGGVHVINKTGPELPSTGGIGTTIFYVAGTVLVVGAGVMLVAKRRMGTEA